MTFQWPPTQIFFVCRRVFKKGWFGKGKEIHHWIACRMADERDEFLMYRKKYGAEIIGEFDSESEAIAVMNQSQVEQMKWHKTHGRQSSASESRTS